MRRIGEKMKLPKRLRPSLDIGFRRSMDAGRVAPASSEASSGDASPSKLSGSSEERDTFDIPEPKKDAKLASIEKERLQQQCKDLEESTKQLRVQNERLAADKKQLQSTISAHEQELRRVKSANQTLEKSVTKLKREIQSINKLKQAVQEQLAEMKGQLEASKAEIAESGKQKRKGINLGWLFVASGAISVAVGAAAGIMRQKGIRLEIHTK